MVEDIGQRRAVDDVVGQVRRIEIEARLPADRDGVTTESQRIDVDAVFARRPIERRASGRIAATRRWAGEPKCVPVVRASIVEGPAGAPIGKFPDAVVALALIDELFLDVCRRSIVIVQPGLDHFRVDERERDVRRVGRAGQGERCVQSSVGLPSDRSSTDRARGATYRELGLRLPGQHGAGRLLDHRIRIRPAIHLQSQR